ncbi:MAG: aminopeptidase P family protein, partial [Pseudomonadota bacterium]
MKTTAEKIASLRALMKEEGLDGFIIPKVDEYQGEFLAPYAERLKWLTGFTGSAGAAIVMHNKACAMSDARYALQLKQEVDMDIFEAVDSVKTGPHGWLEKHADEGDVIGFDPWLHTPDQIHKIREAIPHAEMLPVSENLIDQLWDDQPEKPCGQVEAFSEDIAGASFADKKSRIAAIIKGKGAHAAIITLPDSISWLLNMRGSDINFIPSILSTVIIFADTEKPVKWILNPDKLKGVELGDDIEVADLQSLEDLSGPVMLDFARSPAWFEEHLAQRGIEVIKSKDPCIDLKAIKTPQEFKAIQNAHIQDGIAIVKFLHWVQNAEGISELTVDEKLQELRAQQKGYRGPSFPTIAGFGPNGAIIHYRASAQSAIEIKGDSLLLVDSGGQYYEGSFAGTTDITRTIAIGQPSVEMKKAFTLVLQGHIALASAQFSKDKTGKDIDDLARQALKAEGLDFAHGTGHGVGCFLAVHEEATSISMRSTDTFKSGMLISNEPGYYKEGDFGIRIENLVFVKEANEDEFCFETVSLAPIDKSLIVASMLSDAEKSWLNDYHQTVFETISPFLSDEETAWLK